MKWWTIFKNGHKSFKFACVNLLISAHLCESWLRPVQIWPLYKNYFVHLKDVLTNIDRFYAKIICVEDKWPNKSPDENKRELLKREAKRSGDGTKSTPAQLLWVELCRSPSAPLLPFMPSQPSAVSHTWPEPLCQLSFTCNNSWDTLTRQQLDLHSPSSLDFQFFCPIWTQASSISDHFHLTPASLSNAICTWHFNILTED